MSFLIRLALFTAFILPVLSTAAAARPSASSDDWTATDPAAHGLDVARLAALDAAITSGQAPDTTSVLVVHQGVLVHEAYFNGADRMTLHNTRSLTKSVTAMLVGAAIDRGMIAGVKAPVLSFFPDRTPAHQGSFKDAITLEDLLTMSAQWECDDNNQYSAGHEERMYVSADWTGFALDLPERGYASWTTRPADSPHGRAFAYCTANSFLLGAIVEHTEYTIEICRNDRDLSGRAQHSTQQQIEMPQLGRSLRNLLFQVGIEFENSGLCCFFRRDIP